MSIIVEPPVALMEWWLHNDDYTEWVLFRETECGGVDAVDYRIMSGSTLEHPNTILERVPHGTTEMSVDVAQLYWMDLVRKGFRRLIDAVGIIEGDKGGITRWLTLNQTRNNYKNT